MESVTLDIDQGTLQGKIATDPYGKTYNAFFRIPYAKPPIGELRFKAPQPPEKWSGVRIADEDGNESIHRSISGELTGSEDCLVLNVYTTELPKTGGKLRPVMVWMHGGAFITGSNSSREYGPDYLIAEDVIMVSINYRLGVLGFLSLEDPSVEVPGNAACKDTVMALKWVQANIKMFGGDPGNVTIFGESAGASLVHLLVLSPMATGLFHKAIAQSACALNPYCMGRSCGKALAQILKCPHTNDKEILSYLQELPTDTLLQGQEQLFDKYTMDWVRFISPIIEKPGSQEAFLTEDPLDLIVAGKYTKVPFIMGYTTHEGYVFELFEKMLVYKQEESFDVEINIPHTFHVKKGSELSKTIAKKIKDFYFGGNSPTAETKEELCDFLTDVAFLRGVYQSAKLHVAASTELIYFYRFSVDAGLNLLKMRAQITDPGAGHGDELGYLFKTAFFPAPEPDSVEEKTVKRMAKLWTNFAKTGNPNTVEDVIWKPVTRQEMNYLDIGETLVSGVNPEKERMDFWDSISKLIPRSCKMLNQKCIRIF